MTAIQLKCFQCDTDDTVRADAMLASVDVGELDPRLAGVVTWICSHCQRVTTAELAWQPFITLVTCGVPLLEESEDNELPDDDLPLHPEGPISRRAFTPDDLLELHELLATDTWFSALSAASGASS
jgi:hypothetical protein